LNSLLKYLLLLSTFTAVVILVHFLLHYFFPNMLKPNFTVLIYVILYLSTFGSFLMIRNVKKLEANIFVQFTILTIVLRLIFFAILSGIIILVDKQGYIQNMALFSILYLLYTLFDIVYEISYPRG